MLNHPFFGTWLIAGIFASLALVVCYTLFTLFNGPGYPSPVIFFRKVTQWIQKHLAQREMQWFYIFLAIIWWTSWFFFASGFILYLIHIFNSD